MRNLLEVTPTAPVCFAAICMLTPLAVRIGVCFYEARRRKLEFWQLLLGTRERKSDDPAGPTQPDYWMPYVLGVLETAGYSAAFAAHQLASIGGWLTFKTVHRVVYAKEADRGPFDRYLLANAVLLAAAYCCARWLF